ncbi:MAG: hypothetical protein WD824_18340 [Cyclobacteriaceae bacterium]
MRFPVQILVIVILGFFMELFLPWWSIAIAAFAGGLLINTKSNFSAGFLAIGILWVVNALITDLSTDTGLADRVARIFMLYSKTLLLLVTFIIGGLVGGFAAMTGGSLRRRKW